MSTESSSVDKRSASWVPWKWHVLGLDLLGVTWFLDPALVLFFMLVLPIWAMLTLIAGLIESHRWAGRVTTVIAVGMIGGCTPAMLWHMQWYETHTARELRTFIASEAAGRPSPRFTPGDVLTELDAASRQRVMAAYAAGDCQRVMQDEWFGHQTLIAQCPDGIRIIAHARERPAGRWTVDIDVMPTERVEPPGHPYPLARVGAIASLEGAAANPRDYCATQAGSHSSQSFRRNTVALGGS